MASGLLYIAFAYPVIFLVAVYLFMMAYNHVLKKHQKDSGNLKPIENYTDALMIAFFLMLLGFFFHGAGDFSGFIGRML